MVNYSNMNFLIQIASEESKMVEVSKLQHAVESLNAELDAAKVAYNCEFEKNAALLNHLDLAAKDNTTLLGTLQELNKENLFLKVRATILFVHLDMKFASKEISWLLRFSHACYCHIAHVVCFQMPSGLLSSIY